MAHDHKFDFGIFIIQTGWSFERLLQQTQTAERLGYHSVWLADHMWNLFNPERDYLECLATMTGLLARTERIRIGSLVICCLFRNPALLAKSLATIDNIGRGRLEIGLGAGWMEPEFAAYGWEFSSIGTRLKRLEETLQVLKAMFAEPKPSFKGRFYQVNDAYNFPKPVQQPHPPITIGGRGEKVMLRIIAQHADRWNIPAGYQELDPLIAAFKGHCRALGRDLDTIQMSEQLLVCIGRNQQEADERWKVGQRVRPFASSGLHGTPDQVIAGLRQRAAKGISMATLIFTEPVPDMIELFAREVMPALS